MLTIRHSLPHSVNFSQVVIAWPIQPVEWLR